MAFLNLDALVESVPLCAEDAVRFLYAAELKKNFPDYVAGSILMMPRPLWLHVHENVAQGEEQKFATKLATEVKRLILVRYHSEGVRRAWDPHGLAVVPHKWVRVKSYAPRVYHIVVDVRISLSEE